MPLRYRKSIKVGPARINLSGSGIGTSVGVKGLRAGVSSKGRSYYSASIPGSGIYTRGSLSGKTQAIQANRSKNIDSIALTLEDGRICHLSPANAETILAQLPKPNLKSGKDLFMIWLLTGLVGGHRYYLGKYKSAILQSVTLGGLVIWWLIDLLLLKSLLDDANTKARIEWSNQEIPCGLLAEYCNM